MTTARLARQMFAVLAGTFFFFASAHAAAPQVRTQAPGYYRLMLGDFEITALSDGVFELNTNEMLTHIEPGRRHDLLARSFQNDALPTSVNAYLINTGDRLVLVDTGAAKLFGPTLGHLLENLAASGYRPDQVDTILITHMHPDHIGGLVIEGRAAFPNATVYAEQREADFWSSTTAREQASADRKGFFDGASTSIEPYASGGRFRTFIGRTDLLPGISAIPAPGHTPGHTIYAVESKGRKLVLWGDLMEVEAIQFIDPAVTILFDSDGPEAASQRPKAYAAAAAGGYLVAASHLPFPGIGHLRAERIGYAWLPIPYGSVP